MYVLHDNHEWYVIDHVLHDVLLRRHQSGL